MAFWCTSRYPSWVFKKWRKCIFDQCSAALHFRRSILNMSLMWFLAWRTSQTNDSRNSRLHRWIKQFAVHILLQFFDGEYFIWISLWMGFLSWLWRYYSFHVSDVLYTNCASFTFVGSPRCSCKPVSHI